MVPRTNSQVPTTVPASSDALVAAGLLPECKFPVVGIPRVLTSTAGEPETTVPASPSALAVVGRAVDVPLAILDALEEDLEPSTEVTEFGRLSPSVRVEVASNWRESNDRVAEVVPLSLGTVKVEVPDQFDMTVADSEDGDPVSGSSSTDNGAPAMHEDLRSVGGSSGRPSALMVGRSHWSEKMTTFPCMRMLWMWPCPEQQHSRRVSRVLILWTQEDCSRTELRFSRVSRNFSTVFSETL